MFGRTEGVMTLLWLFVLLRSCGPFLQRRAVQRQQQLSNHSE